MQVILSVGSTSFPSLVNNFISQPSLDALAQLNPTTVTIQLGTQQLPSTLPKTPFKLIMKFFMPDLEQQIANANLVITHAGAGSILSFIRSNSETTPTKRTLIIVPNDTLMDSHQADLADEMHNKGWAVVCRGPEDLAETLERLSKTWNDEEARDGKADYPVFDKDRLTRILDDTLGF
ncbi:hypothetical protein P7C70_g3604, partial [Phenoliferia sp. Uapishka_3]